ncbi:hypothetical protein Tco_1094307 [Tanacetum coccineum]|uniref:Uncharacterized protein n=1 Tax=Tanacetum coccineum TaxID=301880 RepID=A0ABQ5IGH1_9ASTR
MEYDSRVNERLMQTTEEKTDTSNALDASSVIIESNGTESQKQDTSSKSGNDAHVNDADIRPIYNEEQWSREAIKSCGTTGWTTTQKTNPLLDIPTAFKSEVLEFLNLDLPPKKDIRPLAQRRYSFKYRYIVQSYRGRTQSLVAKKKDISENRASRNFDLMITTVDASFLKDKRRQIMTNSDPFFAPRQNVVPSAEKPISSHEGLEFLFCPLVENITIQLTIKLRKIKQWIKALKCIVSRS